MKLVLILFLALFSAFACRSQDIYLDLHGKKVSHFIALENKKGSVVYNDGLNHVSFDKDIAQPVIYRRPEKTIPDLLVYYTFSKTDSLIDHVLYEWDVENFEKGLNNKKTVAYERLLVEKYNTLLEHVTAKFGKSKSTGDLSDLSQSDTRNGVDKSDSWKPNDSTEVKLYASISNFYEKRGMVTSPTTHRIRLYVYNIKKRVEPKFSDKQISDADSIVKEFILKIRAGEFDASKNFLVQTLASSVTIAQLQGLKDQLRATEKIELFTKGFEFAPNGLSGLMLQYRYETDKENPPLEVIKVLLDDKNKILGIRPLKRQ